MTMVKRLSRSLEAWILAGAASIAGVLVAAGGCGSPSQPTPTTTTTTTSTTTTTTLAGRVNLGCNPTPPPLYRINVRVQALGDGHSRILDSRPVVINVNGYCEAHTGRGGDFCFTSREQDSDMIACDQMAVGKARDTGRYGPMWFYEGQPCVAGTDPGCNNNSNNQFQVRAKGNGVFQACPDPSVPKSEDPDFPYHGCGRCVIKRDGQADCE